MSGILKSILAGCIALQLFAESADAATIRAKRLQKIPLDKLIALYVDSKANVDRDALKDALRVKLSDLSEEELLEIRKQVDAHPGHHVDYAYRPLIDLVTPNSLVVYGRVKEAAYNREGLIEDILERQSGADPDRVTLEVLEISPQEPSARVLTYDTKGQTSAIAPPPGYEAVFVLNQEHGAITGGGITSVFPVKNGMVDRVVERVDLPLPSMWEIVNARQNIGKDATSTAELQPWLARLDGDNLDDCLMAVAVLEGSNNAPLKPARVMDAVERQYRRVHSGLEDTQEFGQSSAAKIAIEKFRALAAPAIRMLTRMKAPAQTTRLYDLYVADMTRHATALFNPQSTRFAPAIVSVVAAQLGPERAQRLRFLFTTNGANGIRLVKLDYQMIQALAGVPGEDIDTLLLEMKTNPDRFNLQKNEISAVTNALATRGLKAGSS